jgi:hypothetical protein
MNRRGERTDRPLGSDAFIAALEARSGRTLARQRPMAKACRTRAEISMVSSEIFIGTI